MATEETTGGGTARADRAYAVVGGVMVFLALFFFVHSLVEGRGEAPLPPGTIPELAILSPAPGETLDQPATVDFDAGTVLSLGRMGWVTPDGMHVHLYIGRTEVMAAAGEVVRIGTTRYRWTLPRVASGETVLRLTWSGEDHRSMAEGASLPVPVRLR